MVTTTDAAKAAALYNSYVEEAETTSVDILQKRINEINAFIAKMNADNKIPYDGRIQFWNIFVAHRDKLQSALDLQKAKPELDKAKTDLENTSKITNVVIYAIAAIAVIVILFFIIKIKNQKS